MGVILEDTEKILAKIKQSIFLEIPSVIIVLSLPFSMIVLANRKEGVFVGFVLLAFILYGIYNIYTKLYNKTLILTDKKIIFEHKESSVVQTKEYTYDQLEQIEFVQSLYGNILNSGLMVLKFKKSEIRINSVKEFEKFKDIIKNSDLLKSKIKE